MYMYILCDAVTSMYPCVYKLLIFVEIHVYIVQYATSINIHYPFHFYQNCLVIFCSKKTVSTLHVCSSS